LPDDIVSAQQPASPSVRFEIAFAPTATPDDVKAFVESVGSRGHDHSGPALGSRGLSCDVFLRLGDKPGAYNDFEEWLWKQTTVRMAVVTFPAGEAHERTPKSRFINVSPADEDGATALVALTRLPAPDVGWPDWKRIRKLLPVDFTLEHDPTNVLVELDIDTDGTVVRAAPVEVPISRNEFFHAIIPGHSHAEGNGSTSVLADAVARVQLHQGFSPAELDGVAVPVRGFRVGVAVSSRELFA
jgi:hypothetical protein